MYLSSFSDYLVEIYADRHWDLQAYIIPVLILLGLFVVGVVVFGAFRIFEHRRRRQYRCLTTVQLNKLPQSTFIKGGTHSDTCAICLEDYTEGDEVRTLPCAHVYHSKCIDPWLLKGRRVCPICKRILFRGHRHRRPIFHRWRSSDDYDAENHQLLSDSISLDDGELSRGGGPNISYGAMNSTTYPLSSALAHVHAEAPYSPCDGSRSSVDHTSGRETSSISNDPDFSSTADTVGKSGKILISANHTHDVFDGDPVSGTRSAAQINSSTPGVNLENCPFTTRC
ncbi:E3 ubiquitin-protein ligase RNF13 [Fasciola hepatica]|uniref:E3 ubiquitin-protein ligase RNF13 n=1 Tax=Fasciola hepatica TaxID=6192 RepID=A0A4E0R904_FASHE|nr:E3 ubiquitin-protein ligase RNF13 [Fasciola hepatica]